MKIFQNALDFSSIKIRDCIVPRTEIVAVDLTATLEDLKSLFVESGISKIIVYDGNIDNVVGYIHSSEMFRNPADWRNNVKEVPIVPETMAAHKLMKLFMQQKKTVAVVVDEFGGIKWNPSQQMESAQNTSWGYGEPPRSLEEFYARLEGQVDAVLSLSNDIWGYCYTQLTDVEQEQNGIYYYDRTPKFDMKRIHAIFSKTPDSK